jgi:hypothetical protein
MTKPKYYIHLAPPITEDNQFKYINYADIDSIKKSSASEIFINDMLEYISAEESKILLTKIKDKLCKNGLLHIQNTDIKGLSLNLIYDQINIDTYQTIMFSGISKKNIFCIDKMKRLISTIPDIKISKIKFLNGINFYVECTKI